MLLKIKVDSDLNSELTTATTWLSSGAQVCLAVVAKTWGSAPRRSGSLMVVREDGTFEGSVSGGCVEGEVIAEAVSLLAAAPEKTHKELTFAVTSEQAWGVGLACGGEITIWLFALGKDQLPPLKTAAAAQLDGKSGILSRSANGFQWSEKRLGAHSHPTADQAGYQIPIESPVALCVVGAVHIAQHLAEMADSCGFKVTIIDPRTAFTENRSFGKAAIALDWPDDYFEANPPTEANAIVTLTHDPKLDDAALRHILCSDAFYIGCLGSKKTHASRVERLKAEGFSTSEIDIIDAPVGLDIGAANPAEIAVAILAKIIETRRNA